MKMLISGIFMLASITVSAHASEVCAISTYMRGLRTIECTGVPVKIAEKTDVLLIIKIMDEAGFDLKNLIEDTYSFSLLFVKTQDSGPF